MPAGKPPGALSPLISSVSSEIPGTYPDRYHDMEFGTRMQARPPHPHPPTHTRTGTPTGTPTRTCACTCTHCVCEAVVSNTGYFVAGIVPFFGAEVHQGGSAGRSFMRKLVGRSLRRAASRGLRGSAVAGPRQGTDPNPDLRRPRSGGPSRRPAARGGRPVDTQIRWEGAAGGALGEEDSVVSALEGHKADKPAQIEHNTDSNQTQNLSNMLRKYTYTQYTNARTHAQASRQAGTYTHTPGDGRGETLETDNRRRSESIQHKATSSGAFH